VPDTHNQRRAFQFLLEHFRPQEPFTRDEFRCALPDWSENSIRTYWSKQIKHLLEPVGYNRFIVTEAFRPYANWDSFRKHIVTQVRRTYSDYTSLAYDNLVIYEFFMPLLTNEGHLRTALDALFYGSSAKFVGITSSPGTPVTTSLGVSNSFPLSEGRNRIGL
jgi:hypothetical protein